MYKRQGVQPNTAVFRLPANAKQQIQTRDLFVTKTAAQSIDFNSGSDNKTNKNHGSRVC